MYSTIKLLTSDMWEKFQQMFDETGFNVYIHCELVELEVPRITEAEKALENWQLVISELMKRTCDIYWRVEKKGNTDQTNSFIRKLKDNLESFLNNQM